MSTESEVHIPLGAITLEGTLCVPDEARGIVLFAHGSGSSRFSPRNGFVARQLRQGRLATLLMDLLTEDEEQQDMYTGHLRFDLDLLARRVVAASEWLGRGTVASGLPIGLFGSSTGGGAALIAAAQRPERIRAVVSRGGRPDLAGPWLSGVRCPTLLIVGGADIPVIRLNRQALEALTCEKRLEIVPGASHLFEEPGTLEKVAVLARDWFVRQLSTSEQPTGTGSEAPRKV